MTHIRGNVIRIINPIPQAANLVHYNGIVGTVQTTVTFSSTTKHLLLENLGWWAMYVSFNGGTTWKGIGGHGTLNIDAAINSLELIADGNTNYQIIINF